jgi:hypothetical protein
VVNDVVPEGETDLQDGERVHALDSEIGRVKGFLADPGRQPRTHVLLQEGHLWGRKEVAMTKKQVEDLPPVS